MVLHANAKLGLAGRLALVRAIEDGVSLKAAAAAFSVSPRGSGVRTRGHGMPVRMQGCCEIRGRAHHGLNSVCDDPLLKAERGLGQLGA